MLVHQKLQYLVTSWVVFFFMCHRRRVVGILLSETDLLNGKAVGGFNCNVVSSASGFLQPKMEEFSASVAASVEAASVVMAWTALAVSSAVYLAMKSHEHTNLISKYHRESQKYAQATEKGPSTKFVIIDKNNITKTIENIGAAKHNSAITGMAFVYPGTKWCGNGNLASSYGDLGKSRETDKCCRAHDYCPLAINGGESREGIVNESPFTVSHCECDKNFYECLDKIDTDDAMLVKYVYFTFARGQCVEYQYPRDCVRWPAVQWFDFTNNCEEWRELTDRPQMLKVVDQKMPHVPFSLLLSAWSKHA